MLGPVSVGKKGFSKGEPGYNQMMSLYYPDPRPELMSNRATTSYLPGCITGETGFPKDSLAYGFGASPRSGRLTPLESSSNPKVNDL
jgi:hypothetical protein